jgi:Flp pilus assembly protein TadG
MTMLSRLAFIKNSVGTASVEFVLMMPILMLLVFTTLEGAQYLYLEHKVIKSVRDGARYAARLPFSNYTCPSTGPSGATLTNIKNLVRTGYTTGDNPNVAGTDNPVIWGWTNTGTNNNVTVTVTCSSGTNTGLYTNTTGGAPRVKVNAVVPYPSLFLLLGFRSAVGARLQAMSQASVTGL